MSHARRLNHQQHCSDSCRPQGHNNLLTQIRTRGRCSVFNPRQLCLAADSGQSKHGLKTQASWDMVPCILGNCYYVLQDDAASIFRAVTLPGLLQKMLQQMPPKSQLHIHQSTRHHIPEDLHLHQHCCTNLKSSKYDLSRYFTV